MERRDTRPIKKVACIKNAVAIEEVSRAVKLIRSRFRDRVDDRSGGSSVLSRVAGGYHGKFLHAVNAQVQAGRPAGRRVRIVVDGQAVYAVVVLVRAVARVA